ncbi:glycoside hydrolase family 16 protein [Mariniphaga sediminis]|uniref:Glycoside hydrolase family 16 protein n=1 Tax=Mariniphaga sediminis TaxID=1628158 RepID=A0A399CVV6_9BACT|nr:glycoside hydrolase family 16 protein [Mariniphaga sediminis]RIH63363.1 glycoside hydrolase family 16 protein [Mariniphaga sediminis]
MRPLNLVAPILLGLFLFCCAAHPPKTNKPLAANDKGYKLIWSDEFDYSGLPDSAKWTYDTEGNNAGWGNNEAQFYTSKRIKNAHVKDGVLHIVAQKEDFGGKEYTSARLITKTAWQYGRFETRAKLPDGRGTWAAIWMMPGGWSFNDGNWPDVGEFDIMEHVGHDAGVIHASAHSRDYQWQKGTQQTDTIHIAEATNKFHTYIWEWTPKVVKAYVDDQLYFEYKNEGLGENKWPYEKPFYLILNVAVGGTWGSMQGIDNEAFPQAMEVDYVRVYQRE